MNNCEALYNELLKTAKYIESIRLTLFNDKTHKKNLCFEDEFNYADDKLFRIQTDIRKIVEYMKGE